MHHWQSGSSCSGRGSGSDRRSRRSSSSSSGSGSRSDSGSGSCDRSPAQSQASRHEGSVHSCTASDRSIEVLSGDEASGGEDDILDSANEADVSQGSMSCLTSPPEMTRTLANAKRGNSHTKMTLTLLHGETSSSTMGWQV